MSLPRLKLTRPGDGRVARVALNRPEVRNAFDDVLVAELTELARDLSRDPSVRVLVLAGEGKAFCAGADLNWMSRMVSYSLEENRRDAEAMAAMYRALDECPKPVVGRIHGAALGGGTGLAAVCDVVVAAEGTLFGTTEVRLGLVPSVIGPYVVRKLGESQARLWFLTGERFEAAEASSAGLVHVVVPEAELDAAVDAIVDSLLLGGPEALSDAKRLARSLGWIPLDAAVKVTVETIAKRRVSAEGQEGMKAFLQKRAAVWPTGEPAAGSPRTPSRPGARKP